MQAIRKILKYPFTKLYAFGTFALDAKSRRWPGLSRFSIWILLTTLLLSIAQVTLHLWLAITLARMPLEASGCYEGHSISGFPELNEKVLRPVTYADIRNQDAISVGGRPSLGYVFNPFSLFVPRPAKGCLEVTSRRADYAKGYCDCCLGSVLRSHHAWVCHRYAFLAQGDEQ